MEVYCRELVLELRKRAEVELRALPGRADGRPPSLLALARFGFTTMLELLVHGAHADVVHVGDLALWPMAWLARLRAPRIRQILSAHGTDIALAHRRGIVAAIYRGYIRLATVALPKAVVLANSRATANLCEVNGFRSVRVVPLGTTLRANLSARHEPYVLFTGRLTGQKGCSWFIQHVLPLLDPAFTLVVAGVVWDPGEKPVLENPKVVFRGPVFDEELAQLRAGATAIVVPNLFMGRDAFEGFGLTALEGAAEGGVVLAANAYGLSDSVRDGETGFLLPPGDAERWAEKIREVAAWSEVQRNAYVERSRAIVAQFYSWSRVAQQTINAYGEPVDSPDLLGKAVAWLNKLRERLAVHRVRVKQIALLISLCGFAIGFAWAATNVSVQWSQIAPLPLVVLFVLGVPFTIALNAAEFRAMMEAADGHASWRTALQISVYASAANMLPVPGGVITRLGAMGVQGIGVKKGSMLNLQFAGFWAGSAAVLSGIAITLHNTALGGEFLVAGIVVLVASTISLRAQRVRYGLIVKIGLIRVGLLAVEAIRMALAVQALGVKLSLIGAAAFAVSSVAGSAVSLVPAGVGIREGVVAVLSPIIGLSPATGFLSAAIDRVAAMACLAVLAFLLLLFSGSLKKAQFHRDDVKESAEKHVS